MTDEYLDAEKRINLDKKALSLARKIAGILKNKGVSPYCVGYHLRSVLDREAPTVRIATSDDDSNGGDPLSWVAETSDSNKRLGLHTLNHVLDSLCYPVPRIQDDSLALILRLTFAMQKGASCHDFDAEPNKTKGEPGDLYNSWNSVCNRESDTVALHAALASGFELRYERMGVLESTRLPRLPPGGFDPRTATGAIFLPSSQFYSHYACGAQKLCDAFGIAPSLVAYRAIMAAVYQLRRYAVPDFAAAESGTSPRGFGPETLTVVIRPHHPFNTVVGATVITESPVMGDLLKEIVTEMVTDHNEINQNMQPWRSYRLTRNIVHGIALPDGLKVADRMRGSAGWGDKFWGYVESTVSSFIKQCGRFCDEKLEGRHLQFGFLLGPAGLLRFWPGNPPLELRAPAAETGTANAAQPKDIARDPSGMVHLLEGAEHSCTVIPYCADGLNGDFFPASLIDLGDFEEALTSWSNGVLWSQAYRPYVFLTKVFPWAVGAVVGPGSHIRLFHEGRLIAFRDGKGWQLYRDPLTAPEIQPWLHRVASGDRCFDALVRSVADTAFQMSPMVREQAHGGFIVYWPSEDALADLDKAVRDTNPKLRQGANIGIRRVKDYEPPIDEGQTPWLSSRSLLKEVREGDEVNATPKWDIDPDVGNLLVRAAMLDGAIVLCGPTCAVSKFGQQIVCDYPTEDGDTDGSGTKAATAAAFVRCLGHVPGMERAFAVKISSDGPVSLYVPGESQGKRIVAKLLASEDEL